MNANDFRELALGFDDTEESAHMGAADFRVGGRIFATLAHEHLGFGNLMLSPELQQSLIAEAPEVFLPVSGGWGRQGVDAHPPGGGDPGAVAQRAPARLEFASAEERQIENERPVSNEAHLERNRRSRRLA